MARDQSEIADGPAEEPQGRSFLGNVRFWGGLGAGALLVLFLAQNLQKAEVNFLWMSYEIRLIFALLIAAVLGGVMVLLFSYFRRRARRRERREERRK